MSARARVLGGRAPTRTTCRGSYTRSVIEEALRLHPPAYIFHRRAKEDDVVCGRRVHAGGAVVMSPLVLDRHPDYWDAPDEFRPAHWLDVEAQKTRPRQCIGNAFSMMESVLVLATLAQTFAPALEKPGLPDVEYLVLARPKGDVRATVRSR